MAHFTVTALFQDAEISFGEGDSHEYATQECIDGISEMYMDLAEDVILECTSTASPAIVRMPLGIKLEVM